MRQTAMVAASVLALVVAVTPVEAQDAAQELELSECAEAQIYLGVVGVSVVASAVGMVQSGQSDQPDLWNNVDDVTSGSETLLNMVRNFRRAVTAQAELCASTEEEPQEERLSENALDSPHVSLEFDSLTPQSGDRIVVDGTEGVIEHLSEEDGYGDHRSVLLKWFMTHGAGQ